MYKVYIYFIKRLCAFAWIRGRYRRRFCYIHIFQWHKKRNIPLWRNGAMFLTYDFSANEQCKETTPPGLRSFYSEMRTITLEPFNLPIFMVPAHHDCYIVRINIFNVYFASAKTSPVRNCRFFDTHKIKYFQHNKSNNKLN